MLKNRKEEIKEGRLQQTSQRRTARNVISINFQIKNPPDLNSEIQKVPLWDEELSPQSFTTFMFFI